MQHTTYMEGALISYFVLGKCRLEVQERKGVSGYYLLPLDFFLPMPSLSTTSSLHLMRRFEASSSLFLEELALLSSALSLSMRGNWAADSFSVASRT